MRTVIQRVSHASVSVDGSVCGKIEQGFMILVGISDEDDEATVTKMAEKISRLRVFDDEDGKMNLNIQQVDGSVLSVSQFTLFADCKKGNRPSFTKAGKPEHAKKMYLYFNDVLRDLGISVEEGIFAAEMKVSLLNDGPITIVLDSKELF